MNIRSVFMQGWRNINLEGKIEYAFILLLIAGAAGACFYYLWFAWIIPYAKLVQRSVAG